MPVFRLLVRVSQHLWRQVPLSTLPGGESVTSVLSCYANFPNPRERERESRRFEGSLRNTHPENDVSKIV